MVSWDVRDGESRVEDGKAWIAVAKARENQLIGCIKQEFFCCVLTSQSTGVRVG